MTKSQITIVLRPVILLAMFLSFGCAQQMKAVKSEPVTEVSSTAQIQSITVADDGGRIEIISDRQIVYTYYMLDNPPRVIVDLAQTAPGQQTFPIDLNKGALKRIDVAKHEFGSGVLSRIDISLNEKSEISAALDQTDKKKLVLTIPVPQAGKQEPVKIEKIESVVSVQEPVIAENQEPKITNVAAVPVVEPVVITDKQASQNQEPVSSVSTQVKVESKESVASSQAAIMAETDKEESSKAKTEPVEVEKSGSLLLSGTASNKLRGERSLTAIKKTDDGLLLELTAEPDSFKVFKLAQPERLVIDIHKTRSAIALKVADINAFNLGKARIGVAPDKLRVVFDSIGTIPHYSVVKSGSGLLIAFGARKQEHVNSAQEPEKKGLKIEEKKESVKVEAAVPVVDNAAVEVATSPVNPVTAKAPIPDSSVATVPVTVPQNTAKAKSAVAGQEPVKTEKAVTEPRSSAAKTAVKKPVAGVVEAVEFSQAEGISRITIKTSGNCVAGEPVKTAKGLSLALKVCRLPVKLQRELDTKGFDSAIKSIAPFNVKSGSAPESRIAVNVKGSVSNALRREGDVIQWDFKEPVKTVKDSKSVKVPKAAAAPKNLPSITLDKDMPDVRTEQVKSKADKSMEEAFQLEKASQPVTRHGKIYTGRKVTLEFSDADIRKIFQLLAEVSNQNFLISDDVTGTISLKLVNVPWDQALDVILENKGLGMQREGNIVQIRPKTKMKSLDDEAIEMRLTEEKKMPLSTVIFDVNFATLGEIETQFKNLKSKRPDSSISNDMRTNKIIVVDIDPNINKMRKLLEQLDIPEKQVMIEARIVEASSNFARDIGVKWNFGYQDGSASIANVNNVTGSMGGVTSLVLPTGTTGGVAAGIGFGKLLSNIQLDMRLSAASTVGQVKIISTPKVMTVNNKPAKISQGQMIPYQNTSSTDGAKTEFIEAALSLEVTPHITADGSVNMKIKASNNTAGVGSPPPINKKEATTELVVKNGETTVIGGIYVDSETEGDTGVPYLSDIPLLGWMFKSNSKSKTKNEMLIFITPRILN